MVEKKSRTRSCDPGWSMSFRFCFCFAARGSQKKLLRGGGGGGGGARDGMVDEESKYSYKVKKGVDGVCVAR
jgi:hypothetical protein